MLPRRCSGPGAEAHCNALVMSVEVVSIGEWAAMGRRLAAMRDAGPMGGVEARAGH